ncbi:MAG: PilZ domain-containing protein, partial [Anaerohalosphaera sp.]|nr:PilZ domain-containing protein [Anaerohalosphaera sp.]
LRLASLSYQFKGRWYKINTKILGFTDSIVHLLSIPDPSDPQASIDLDQLVGISTSCNEINYLAETIIVGFDPMINNGLAGLITVKMPDFVEKMRRRAFDRANTPGDMIVKALFWHSGYSDNAALVPLQCYWEGLLIDISVGGLQLSVSQELAGNYREGQFVGIQFTPLPHYRPIIVDGIIRHIGPTNDSRISLGIKFLGLETTSEGREKLARINETVELYTKINA